MRVLILKLLALGLVAQPAQANFKDFGIPDFHSIIGGTEVAATDPIASSTVLVISVEGSRNSICTGSILDTNIILTAAHCVGLFESARVFVAFRNNINGEGPVIPAVETRRPSDFLERVLGGSHVDWNDIALVKLAAPIPAGFTTSKILPRRDLLTSGMNVTLAGYGMSVPLPPTDGSPSGSGILRKVEQTVLDAHFASTEFLVSLSGGRGACRGDSGGPAFVQLGKEHYLIGVASRMTENNRVANNGDTSDFSCSVDMVYGNVLAQMDWIQATKEELQKAR